MQSGTRSRGGLPDQPATILHRRRRDISSDVARIWLLTNDATRWHEYQVSFGAITEPGASRFRPAVFRQVLQTMFVNGYAT